MPDADKVNFEPFEPQPLADYLPRLTANEPNGGQALDFLEGLVRLDPERRMTAPEALRHPWLQGTVLLPATHQTQAGAGNVTQLEDGRTLLDVLQPAVETAEERLDDLLERDLE
jgi:serine/threonine protein kinase